MDAGIQAAAGTPIATPLPTTWLGLPGMPLQPPAWATIGILTTKQIKNLQAQIGYDLSQWNYSLVGNNNALGRYQFTTTALESYGLLAVGSNSAYGTDCVNYRHCWNPTYFNNGQNAYENYFYNITSITGFLTTTVAQEHLAYQNLVDLYVALTNIGAIKKTDTADVVAGMLYVGWTLGATGANAWRYTNVGSGATSYNSGRYSVIVLSA
jgi:hypothetical protein